MPEEADEKLTLASDPDVTVPALKLAQSKFEIYRSQRKDWEDVWNVADYMMKAGQNRSLRLTEMTRGVNPSWDASDNENANTGSTIYFRQTRQLASQLSSVAMSGDAPFKYLPIGNASVFDSEEEARAEADQWNCYARWVMKQDRFAYKFITLAHLLKKYGNVPVMFAQEIEKKQIIETKPTFKMGIGEDGLPKPVQDGTRKVKKTVTTKNYPSMIVLPVDSVYADAHIGNLQSQECVCVWGLQSTSDIRQGVKDGTYEKGQVEKLTKAHAWDGNSPDGIKEEKLENEDITSSNIQSGDQFPIWTIFLRCPITNKKWDDEDNDAVPDYDTYKLSVCGNTIEGGIVLAFEELDEPDGEIPIYMLHSLPDDDDILYHVSEAQIIRSNYSVECTIKNQMIDNNSLINHPPMREIEGQVRGTDRKFGPDAVFKMDAVNALSEFEIRDLAQSNMAFMEYIKNDTKEALSTVSNVMGEAYGGRTSALEASNAYRNSIQPHMVTIRYNLEQILYLYARKIMSYTRRYADKDQVVSITDADMFRTVRPKDLKGEFDIEISIVDDYENDMAVGAKLDNLLKIASSSPYIAKYIDFGEFITTLLNKQKGIPVSRIVKRPMDYDAASKARSENEQMMGSGTYIAPHEGENNDIHMREHRSERLRYKGIEQEYPHVVLLDQHMEATDLMMKNEQASMNQNLQASAPSGNQGPGEEGGNAIAGALGGMMGGANNTPGAGGVTTGA